MIRIGLIQFPGSNCERETALAVKRAGMEAVEFLWNEPLAKLCKLDGYILIGGFSYEDRSRAGIIAALDPVIQEIKTQSEKGKPVLGICNGAQILVEAGLVPGLANKRSTLALTENRRIAEGKIIGTGFYNTWVHMRLATKSKPNAFTRYLSAKDPIYLPIAHAEGRFLMAEDLLKELESQGLVLFQYCDPKGEIVDNFPTNPNGSVGNIAALGNQAGNVMAMMPHPERTENGDAIFRSMYSYISDQNKEFKAANQSTLSYRKPQIFQPKANAHLCLVKLIITDNQALTVQKTLRRLGFPVQVNRFEHWEIDCDSMESLAQLKKSGLLYADRKEREISMNELRSAQAQTYLIRAKDDLRGQQTLQTLKAHYAIQQVQGIRHGVVWQFSSEEAEIAKLMDDILLTNIIGNQYAHECYLYA